MAPADDNNITGSHYYNPSFCWPDQIDADYYNRVTAHPGGDYGYADFDEIIEVGGGYCTNLLTPHIDRVS